MVRVHVKPRIERYRLAQLTTATLQEFINGIYVDYGYTRNYIKNILKVLKSSLVYVTDVVGYIKENPAIKVKMPRYDVPDTDPAHIFTKEEFGIILKRF